MTKMEIMTMNEQQISFAILTVVFAICAGIIASMDEYDMFGSAKRVFTRLFTMVSTVCMFLTILL